MYMSESQVTEFGKSVQQKYSIRVQQQSYVKDFYTVFRYDDVDNIFQEFWSTENKTNHFSNTDFIPVPFTALRVD